MSGGLIEENDARATNAPLIEQREKARDQLAALPSAQPAPAFDEVAADTFRTGVHEAWNDYPLTDCREALDRVLDEVRLSPGGVHITYGLAGYHGHDPHGLPYAPISDHVPSLASESGQPLAIRRSSTRQRPPSMANTRYRMLPFPRASASVVAPAHRSSAASCRTTYGSWICPWRTRSASD